MKRPLIPPDTVTAMADPMGTASPTVTAGRLQAGPAPPRKARLPRRPIIHPPNDFRRSCDRDTRSLAHLTPGTCPVLLEPRRATIFQCLPIFLSSVAWV